MQTYALATLGCKVNQYEGETLKGQLAQLKAVAFGQPADLYIINTCSVTADAEAKARQLIGRAKRGAPDALIVLTGCWREAETENLKALGVDLFFNNAEKLDLAKRLPLKQDLEPVSVRTKAPSRTRLVVKVQDGCDESCAYCAIPGFRGRLVSRPKAEIVREIDNAVTSGTNEVVLTGIHMGKYGFDLSGRLSLTELIANILSKTSLKRLRLSSIEPQEITDELIDLMAGTPRLARHLHIPLQSGSDAILESMNRRYRRADYLELISKVRGHLPQIGLTTDVMVGFPGETDSNFDETLSLIEAAALNRLHIFKYSPRPETPAATFKNQIDPGTKKMRASRVHELGQKLAEDFTGGFVGRKVWVLVERQKNARQSGLTSEYVRVIFDETNNCVGDLVEAVGIRREEEVLMVRSHLGG